MKYLDISRRAAVLASLLLAACQAADLQVGVDGIRTVPRDPVLASPSTRNDGLERCTFPLATVELVDGNVSGARQMDSNRASTAMLMRDLIQQSNCFSSIERPYPPANEKSAFDRSRPMTEYDRGRASERMNPVDRSDSLSTPRSADYELLTEVVIRNDGGRSSGIGNTVGNLMGGRHSSALSSLGGSIQKRTANAQLTLIDARTRVPAAVSKGSSSGTSFDGLDGVVGGGNDAETPQERVVSLAVVEAFNKMVVSLRANRKTRSNQEATP